MNYEENQAFINAVEKANEILKSNDFPVPIREMIEGDPDVELLTFFEFARITGVSLSEVAGVGQSDEAFHFRKGNKAVVVYNTLKYIKRARFTLAHEYGHIKMGHQGTSIYDTTGSNSIYTREEFEADTFAGALLFPLHMRYACRDKSTYEIANAFNLSFKAVRVCMYQFRRHMSLGLEKHLSSYQHRLPDSYINFLREHSY
ncbi:ImmA/IrrE family metallo-endopeptidase [Staphylococcus cohnii]|nr:ImmA/IrrE family metallo-endopeptidase [Staphylococcus cohnii]